MSDWYYTPITIHYYDASQLHASSGVYLFNAVTAEYFFITLVSVSDPNSFTYSFTAKQLISNTQINWVPLVITDTKKLKKKPGVRGFHNFIDGLLRSDGFEFSPNKDHDLSILAFKLGVEIPDPYNPIVALNSMEKFQIATSADVAIPSDVIIRCCPFSLTNVAIFIDYKIKASINFKIAKSNGYFSDCRYLDDMIGGIVNHGHGSQSSIGLIAGCLKKKNGDGNLLTIISWKAIIEELNNPRFEMDRLREISYSLTSSIRKDNKVVESVVRLSVQTITGDKFWGSGVVLSPNLIITNEHVMKKDVLLSFYISFANNSTIRLDHTNFEVIDCPITGYDICFLKLINSDFSLKPAKSCSSYMSQLNSLMIGSPVTSIGYGLMYTYNKEELCPIRSKGIINTAVPMEIENGYQELALVIASAACWNGSSGGGVFNERGELIGIMTSNGKLSTGEIIPNFTLIIPITIIEKCKFMLENNLKPVDISSKIKDLWFLKSTHESILMEPKKSRRNKL